MEDVATRASVSQTTVSYVLNGRTTGVNIPTPTRHRVLEAARELGYRRNQLARAMVTGKSRILGVYTTPIGAGHMVNILAGAMEAANNHEYLLKVMHLSWQGIDEATISRSLEWRLAGAIVFGLSEEFQGFIGSTLEESNIPSVMVDNSSPRPLGGRILSDDNQGICQAVSHLTGLGHRRIAFLGGKSSFLSDWREKSFRAALADANLTVPDAWVRHTSWSEQPIIEEGVHALLGNPEMRPTAIVCCGDSIAMIVLRVASSLGLRVPEDLSVTGYSNENLSSFANPPLTTIDQPFYAMGYAAAEYLVGCNEKPDEESFHENRDRTKMPDILLPTKLIERASTGVAPDQHLLF